MKDIATLKPGLQLNFKVINETIISKYLLHFLSVILFRFSNLCINLLVLAIGNYSYWFLSKLKPHMSMVHVLNTFIFYHVLAKMSPRLLLAVNTAAKSYFQFIEVNSCNECSWYNRTRFASLQSKYAEHSRMSSRI